MPPIKKTTYWLLVHPQATDLAWGPRGWRRFEDATVFSAVGKSMFEARRKVRGRWMSYPDAITNPPKPSWIDLNRTVPLNSEQNIHDPNRRAVVRERNRLAREERARILREQDPLPTGVKHG